MRMLVAVFAVGALFFGCSPVTAARVSCKDWNSALSAARVETFETIRGAPIRPGMYESKLQISGFGHCVVGITNSALLMCFLNLPNETAGREAYAHAIASMDTCLSGWSPLELGVASSGPERLAGRRVTQTLESMKLQAVVTLLGPAKADASNHVVSLGIGPLISPPEL
jgi:hypothetical protein